MSAFNIVRFKVKPGREQEFIDAHRNIKPDLPGFRRGVLVSTGDRGYCFIGEWENAGDSLKAEDDMIAILDSFRDTLEDLGNGLGVTDPVFGESVAEVSA